MQKKRFDELTTRELYELLVLRTEIFVVEQDCPYQEVDGKDVTAVHYWICLLYTSASPRDAHESRMQSSA